jgi:hypothetical protein
MAALRCSCGYLLTYETDICPVCLPHGLGPAPKATGLRAVADFLGLTHATESAIIDAIDQICIVRDKHEELESMYCSENETLSDYLVRKDGESERMFNAGYENGLGVAIQAIEHEKEERTAYHAWDGMKRAIGAIQAVKDGTFKWVESSEDR